MVDNRQLTPAPQGAPSTALALPREIALMQTVDSELATRALAIFLSRPADRPISPARAISAALNERETGHREGRDFYIDEDMGIVPGYRGLMRDSAESGAGAHMETYRPMTALEEEEHEIRPGDTTCICELTQIAVYRQAREAGLAYAPVLGVGIVRAREKVTRENKPIYLKGGYTWTRKARNRAFKDALRHAGFAAEASEVIEDAEYNGIHVEIPEGQHVSVEQAEAAVAYARQAATHVPATEAERRAAVDAMRGPEGFKGFGDGDEDEGDIVTGTAREIETGDPDAAAKIAAAEAHARADADFAAMQSRSATDTPATAPAPEATSAPNGKRIACNITKAKGFVEAVTALVEKHESAGVSTGYKLAKGGYDFEHVRYSLGALGYIELTTEQLPAAINALEGRIMAKLQAETA